MALNRAVVIFQARESFAGGFAGEGAGEGGTGFFSWGGVGSWLAIVSIVGFAPTVGCPSGFTARRLNYSAICSGVAAGVSLTLAGRGRT